MSGYIYKNVKKTLWINIKRIHALFLHTPIHISQVCLTPPPRPASPHSSLPLLANWNLRRGGSSSLGVWREHIHRSSIYLTIFLSIYLSYQFDCLYWICDNNTRTYYSGADIGGGGGFCPSSTPWYYFHVCTIFNVWTTFK